MNSNRIGAFWEARRLQGSRVTHVTTVSSVNEDLTNRVPELRDFKTYGGSIAKIETLVVELKIVINFRGVIRTFPLKKFGYTYFSLK